MTLSRNQKIGITVVSALLMGGVIYFAFIRKAAEVVDDFNEDPSLGGGDSGGLGGQPAGTLPEPTTVISTMPKSETVQFVTLTAAKNGILATLDEINQVALMLTPQKGPDNRRNGTSNENRLLSAVSRDRAAMWAAGKTAAQLKEEAKKSTGGRG